MNTPHREPGQRGPATADPPAPPIKLPDPPDTGSGKVMPEIPKVGSKDAPGG